MSNLLDGTSVVRRLTNGRVMAVICTLLDHFGWLNSKLGRPYQAETYTLITTCK